MESDSSDSPSYLRAGLNKITSLFKREAVVPVDETEQARNAWMHFMENRDYQLHHHFVNPEHYIQRVAKFYGTTVDAMREHGRAI